MVMKTIRVAGSSNHRLESRIPVSNLTKPLMSVIYPTCAVNVPVVPHAVAWIVKNPELTSVGSAVVSLSGFTSLLNGSFGKSINATTFCPEITDQLIFGPCNSGGTSRPSPYFGVAVRTAIQPIGRRPDVFEGTGTEAIQSYPKGATRSAGTTQGAAPPGGVGAGVEGAAVGRTVPAGRVMITF
jgi:hypothetical protein